MRFLPALRGKALLPVPYVGPTVPGLSDYYTDLWRSMSARARPWPIERAVAEGYERVIWVFKSVDAIAGDQASLPYRIRDRGQIVDDHPLCRVLNHQANPLETGQIFRKRLSAQILLSKKGAFVEVTFNRWNEIVRVDLLPPDRVDIIPGQDGKLIDHFQLSLRMGGIRQIDPAKVRWFRNPHPTDPYSGVTPLEAMGMSVELDHFARLYNVNFMRNDSRPGGIVGVKGDMDEDEMDRVESRFGRGPVEAGKMTVIAGELSYVDPVGKPRDMQYTASTRNSKIEILSGFGVSESVMGYSSEKTFDNAAQELYNYWTRTMPEHNGIVVTGWDADSDDGLEGFLDTSDVEVLQRAERDKRAEAREEVTLGVRSIKSYADLAGYGDEIDDTPLTRALYVSQGRTPTPSREADSEALGLGQPVAPSDGGGAGTDALAAAGAPGGAGSDALAAADPAALPAAPTGPAAAPAGPVPTDIEASPGLRGDPAAPGVTELNAGATALRSALGGKAANGRPVMRLVPKPDDAHPESAPDMRAWARLEDTLTAALTAQALRWTARTIARLESPKARRHTRHWVAEQPDDTRIGVKAIDTARAVDPQQWQVEAQDTVNPILVAAATVAAAAILVELADMPRQVAADTAKAIVAGAVTDATLMVGAAAAKAAALLVDALAAADGEGATLTELTGVVSMFGERVTGWLTRLAGDATAAVTNGARDAAAASLPAPGIVRYWETRRDDKVRPSHVHARGQVQKLGIPFIVGDSLLRFPGDPLAPPHERCNCRCWLLHRATATGRFTAAPQPADLRTEALA